MLHFDVRRVCLLIFLIVGGAIQLFSQSYSGINWYFGNNTNSIRFVRPDYMPEAITIPHALGTGMSAVATDPVSGSILFYTDGVQVYDATDTQMPNGNGLMGSSTFNQGIAISANPVVSNEYFIFTNDGTLRRTVVDMNANGNGPGFPAPELGDVTTKNDVTGLPATPRSEGMIVVPNASRNGFWLISHEAGTSNYDVTQIDSTGAITTLPTNTLAGAPTEVANFSYHAGSNQIAVSPLLPTEQVAILSIDPATGALSLVTSITGTDASSLAGQNIYDIEWSNNGQFIYLSGNFGGAQDQLMQVDLTESPTVVRPLITQDISRSYGLQMAPDSTIYHLYQSGSGQFLVGRINDPDTVAGQTLYDPTALGSQNYQGRQFPAFLPDFDPMLTVDFTFSGTCANIPTLFFPDITPGADSVIWDFGDGNFSGELGTFNTYTAAGSYNVQLTAFLNGQSQVATKTVDITDFDLQISGIPQSDTVCAEDFPVSYTAQASGSNTSGVTFRWSNQTTDGATTSIDSAGNYYVVATQGSCQAYAPLQVVEYGAIEQRAFIWYFGEHAGIDFNPMVDPVSPGPPRAIPYGDPDDLNGGNEMIAPEGCAIYCDQNGVPLFYSDGSNVYDREGNQFATGAGGDTDATQSVFIAEFPNDATLFYIFLTKKIYDDTGNDAYDFSYVVFDLKKRNGLGDLIRDDSDQVITTTLYSGNTERVTGSANWVIVHEYGNNNFRAYPITANGIGTPVISNVGSVHPTSSELAGRGYMKLANSGKLAVALSISLNENYVELFDFTDSTGAVSRPVKLDLAPETGQVYGIEFSQDERKLFATLRDTINNISQIYRWEIDTTTLPLNVTDPQYIKDSRRQIASEVGIDFGAMQLGPDGQIYVARNGDAGLATIGSPNDTTGVSNYLLDGFSLAPNLVDGGSTMSTLGMPNFADQFTTSPQTITLNTSNGCSGESLTFSVANPNSLEQYRWNIIDASNTVITSGTGTSFTFTISQPGTYTARVDVIPECQIVENPPAPALQQFVIYNLPSFTIDQVVDVTGSCGDANGSFRVVNSEAGTFVLSISGPVPTPADTVTSPYTNTFSGLSAGGYIATFTNAATGCSTSVSQAINDPAPWSITLGTSLADCAGENGNINVSISGAPNYPVSYILRDQSASTVVGSGSDDNTDGDNSFDITSNAGTFTVEVAEAGANGCRVTQTDITVGTPPLVTLNLPFEVVLCDATEARVPFSTNANALAVVDGPAQTTFVGDTIVITTAGIYTVETQDDTGNLCNVRQDIEVIFNTSNENPFASRYTICPEDPLNDEVHLYPGPEFLDAQYLDEDGNLISSGSDYEFSGDTLIVKIDAPITALLTNAFGCVTTADIDIVEDCKARIKAPTAFTPNGDGNNDDFFVFPILVSDQDFQIFIFNRWGEMIFQSSDINFKWNGGYNNDINRPLPGGTYAYKINFRSEFEPEKGLQEQRGGVTLIR